MLSARIYCQVIAAEMSDSLLHFRVFALTGRQTRLFSVAVPEVFLLI